MSDYPKNEADAHVVALLRDGLTAAHPNVAFSHCICDPRNKPATQGDKR